MPLPASVSAYTTLESLLIFQCLKSYGVTPNAFSKTSELLKANPDITGHSFFQSGRLSPDALRSFYLERLRRELALDLAPANDADAHHAENPKKRKATAPALPTVQDSLQYAHLMPKLVDKLYATYRTEMVDHIRADELRYEKLQREVESIERGEWDEQLHARRSGKTPSSRSPSLAKKSPQVAQSPLPQPAVQNGARGPDGPPQTPQPEHAVAAAPKTSPRKKKDKPSASATSQQPAAAAPHQPAAATSPTPHQPQPQLQSQPPHPQQHPPPSAAYNGPSYPHLSPYPPGQPPLQPSPQQGHARPHPQSPASGPPGPQHQPQPIQPYAPNGVPQYGPPHFPPNQRFPQQPSGPHSPSMHTPQQQKGYFPHPGPPSHPPQHLNHPPPPQAGFMLPPFQVSPQDPSRVHHPPITTPQYPQVSTPINKRSSSQSHHQTPGVNASRQGPPPIHPLVTQARQSFSTPRNSRSPHSAISTPQSAKTFWKPQVPGTPGGAPGTPRPVMEPIDDFLPLSAAKPSPAKPKSQRKPRGKGKAKERENDKTSEERQPETPLPTSSLEVPAPDSGTRQGRSRRKAPAKRGRPGSVASSRAGGSVRDRSRSRSILSHTETIADTDSQAGHRIKTERRGSMDDGIEEEPVNTPSQMTTRRRGAATTTAPLSTRRKRNAREASLAESEDTPGTPGPPRTVLAHRNFHRTCQPMLDDITSHKHASIFTVAVRPKDAEGYYDIIKRPTDLSTIKKALSNGAKYVTAIASDTPIGSPGGSGATIELPISSDVVPPKAIVNPSQLEKELMRMFVNAMMFNPGEKGVVEDAREMFESVQRSVSSWRNVHGRSQGRADQGEGTPVEGEEEGTSSKRRKV
ncbi:hypothetical protein N0V95_009911 [Ascochyta clinopodiicola]|nr:hypothetical protein N0V95_009911 [Ascochyta clinopodiicola]